VISPSDELRERIIKLKDRETSLSIKKEEQKEYLNKLYLLLNQYDSEINKRQMAKEGYLAFDQYEFLYCPNCMTPLKADSKTYDICCLCGNDKSENTNEQLIIIGKEIKQIKRKSNELKKFIEKEDFNLDLLIRNEKQCLKDLAEAEQELQHLYDNYDNPQLEQIELLNYEIGQKISLQNEYEHNLKMIEELKRIEKNLTDKIDNIKELNETIKKLLETTTNKQELIGNISSCFTDILQSFEYPKLSNSYIDEKTYLPFVRGHKYNDIGSLAGVTLITMAYYLAIMLVGVKDEFHHLNLLMIDSPRKNLGAKVTTDIDEEFKDEKIFDAIIRCFINIDKEYTDNIQLIIVNNGYPNFLDNHYIVAEFDTEKDDLPNGLIEDII
jgi:DNA repair exonuclease SbcCD ATPase subunit